MTQTVVITAADIITSNADSYHSFASALETGISVSRVPSSFDTTGLAAHKGFFIPSTYAPAGTNREELDRHLLTHLISRNSDTLPRNWQSADLIIATTMGAGITGQSLIRRAYTCEEYSFSREEVVPSFSSSIAEYMRERLQMSGTSLTVCDACASGTSAIGIARQQILAGMTDCVIVCGVNILFEMPFYGFSSLRLLAPDVCAPFDLYRKGLILGEAACFLYMESIEQAQTRGAAILAEVAGYGASGDADHITAPQKRGDGAARAMRNALRDARVSPDSIDYINAHGTGTKFNDLAETHAIKQVFGNQCSPPVSSTKSYIGHTLGAAGITEAIASITALNTGLLHPTLHLTTPDPDCNLTHISIEPRYQKIRTVMSNSFGFGGNNAVVILKKHEGAS